MERLLNTLYSDQTTTTTTDGGNDVNSISGRTHGCVGSHWELLPPLYDIKKEKEGTNIEGSAGQDSNNNNDNAPEPHQSSPPPPTIVQQPGGGIRLPGLDWNKTFRKGYSVLVWVRPSLTNPIMVPHHQVGGVGVEQPQPQPQKQILYRFATSPNDSSKKSVGVCAILGQWQATASNMPHMTKKSSDGGIGHQTMYLTTSITAYTLPNSDPMSHLYPVVVNNEEGNDVSGSFTTAENLTLRSSSTNNNNTVDELLSPMDDTTTTNTKKSRKERSKRRGSSANKEKESPTIGFRKSNAVGPSADGSIHALNMEHFQQRQQQQQGGGASGSSSAATNDPRLIGKVKKLGRRGGNNNNNSSPTKVRGRVDSASSVDSGGYITSNIVLPANEWSLICIQHTHPYLRRPELIVSVNGEEMLRGELGYPVLDAVVFPSGTDQQQEQDVQLLSTSRSFTSPTAASKGGSTFVSDNVEELITLRRRGILADCTLLNGTFNNGVQVIDKSTSRRTRPAPTLWSCNMSVHSLALLPGPPVPNAVLAIIAERGPLGDSSSSSGSGLSFVIGPVPTNPQNRDAVVALTAGHGYYGSTPDSNSGTTPRGGSKGGIMGGGGPGRGMHDLVPPRSLGIPVSIGITPGVYPGGGSNTSLSNGGSSGHDGSSSSDALVKGEETWIGRGEEHAAHVCLQGLLGRAAWTFHSADTIILGNIDSSVAAASGKGEENDSNRRPRIVCIPSAAPSRIGGADAVPKVGIVRPTPPNHALIPTGLEFMGNATANNVTWNYIQREMQRDCNIKIGPPQSATCPAVTEYNIDDNPPVSFTRAIQAANTINICLLPFRLALPHAGIEEVNDAQRTLHIESFTHLNDLLCNDGELAARLIRFIAECIRCGGSAIRDEALQNGVIHALASLLRKVLIRGARLGLLGDEKPPSNSSTSEDFDYDKDHDSSCPPVIPSAIANAIIYLIDACCGPSLGDGGFDLSSGGIISNPNRGVLRIRRASDLALTALFGLAMDFDLLGNDPSAAAPILNAIASRYCQLDTTFMNGDGASAFNGEDYGSLLRKQINLQYFLDCLRIRFDHSVESSSKGLMTSHQSMDADRSIVSVASSLSDILYTMLLSTLTSAAGISVSRGERDVGALVATLTECPLGSLCAHVVTTSIARLLVKCGVMSSLCLGASAPSRNHQQRRKSEARRIKRDPEDIALESRLGRNLLLCHYHDIVAPLLLSRSTPRSSLQLKAMENDGEGKKNNGNQEVSSQSIGFTNTKSTGEVSHPLDWSHHWRLSLLTFSWLSSLAGMDESQTISSSTGHLLLLAGQAGSLDGAVLGHKRDEKSVDMLAVLSHFLVLSDSRAKDNSGIGKRAESISRRVSSFMPLVPGIAISLLSSSLNRNGSNGSKTKMTITNDTVVAVDTLKNLLSMLSLAIQALYGSKKGGLLSARTGTKSGGQAQLNRAKKIFVSGAKEYAPILLQVVSLLAEPIKLSRQLAKKQSKDKKQHEKTKLERQTSDASQPSEPIPRKRTDSSDKDWVDVPHSPSNEDRLPSEDTISSSPKISKDATSSKKTMEETKNKSSIEQSVYDNLSSIQDMALYAVSRLIAQAMKYGGGEASTAIWRSVLTILSDSNLTVTAASSNENKPISTKESDGEDVLTPVKAEETLSKPTLCHLSALVLSKFARHHDHRLETYRSPWNLETCSAVARLMDLVEEKQLLTQADTGSRPSSDNASVGSDSSRKYGIDQVRLLKALLEVMASGRESGGWSQVKPPAKSDGEEAKKNEGTDSSGVATAPHSNHGVKACGLSNSKLLLPILQSCVRIVCPATGIIRSEAVVITASSGNSPSTAKLLGLVCVELQKSLLCAIEGLGFPISRDIFMNAVASLRRAIIHHENVGDSKAVILCSLSLVEMVKAMRSRYVSESVRKSFKAYEEDNEATTKSQDDEKAKTEETSSPSKSKVDEEDIHSQVIEKLIMGDSLPQNDADFVGFPGGDGNHDDDPSKLLLSPMGWSHYKGLGAALNRCYSEQETVVSLEKKAKIVLSILEMYIDNWDKIQIQDAAEAELVDLFDINLGSSASKSLINDFNALSKAPESTRRSSSANFPALSTSDAMTRFIEAQSMLRNQHQYLAFEYLVGRRFGRSAFVERLCWKTWMDCVDVASCTRLWERAVNDGGRGFSSKITTLPIFPQFPRFIPSYLDHSPSSSSDMDINKISRNLSVKIVDITKKEITEEMLEHYDSMNEAAMDDAIAEEDVFNEEEADMHFARGASNYSTDANGENPDDIADAMTEKFVEEEADMSFSRHSGEDEDAESEINGDADDNMEMGTIKEEEKEEDTPMYNLAIQQGSFHFAASSFSFPPDSSSLNSLGEGRRLGGGSMEEYYGSCVQIKPDASLKCTLMLTESHLIIEYEDDEISSEDPESTNPYLKKKDELSVEEAKKREEEKLMKQSLRPKAMRWNISEASHIYLRRYRLRDSALEIFFIPSAGAVIGGSGFFAGARSLFIDFGPGTWGNTRRDDAANAIMKRAPMQTVKQWPDKSGQFLHEELKKLMQAWTHGAISNFDYLLSLNVLAGRSYNDICQYPVFPWVLSNYTSEEVPDLHDRANFRDMTKPMGALNEERLVELLDRFNTFDDPSIPPFMYGSHYSTSAGVVIHFLLRLHPFASLHRQLQSGHFDVADRLFSSIYQSWKMCTGRSAAEVKELTPEFYSNPAFLRNTNEFKLGTSQEGEVLGDVVLPPWAKGSPERFVEVMRLALESDIASEMLPDWIDLIFGRKQQGKASIEANNVFFYLTYYGSVDVASIEDEGLRIATELQIAHFGQCPMQLFYRRHAKKHSRSSETHRRRQTLSELYDMKRKPLSRDPGSSLLSRPFANAPMSYWVHLGAPPPGPHAPLISIRLALADRCLAVDSKGIFHFFRWAWKPEDDDLGSSDTTDDNEVTPSAEEKNDLFKDQGCFVAQRELFSFRNIPRLPYALATGDDDTGNVVAAISKTLFANRSLLLVVSDGDGKGAIAMQLVDPVKGEIKGEVIVPSIHADRITSVDMDPIGTAAGQGGVGGELVIVGSADGSATLWRFISSHYWPLRPRLRMMGHGGARVHGVAISSSLGICASISSKLCCLFDVGNAIMIRNFSPPTVTGIDYPEGCVAETTFADTPALCLSILGFVITVCSTKVMNGETLLPEVLSLELFTVEGEHVSSHILEQQLGMPKKIIPTVDGRAVFVCAGGGVTVHLVSSYQPLVTIDKWKLDEPLAKQQAVYDLDFGPTIARPVVAAAACSAGSLRLHALRGISKWSNEHQRNTVSGAVGSVLALPAQTVKNALGGVSSFGSSFFGSAKEISKEALSVVKEREGGLFFRKKK